MFIAVVLDLFMVVVLCLAVFVVPGWLVCCGFVVVMLLLSWPFWLVVGLVVMAVFFLSQSKRAQVASCGCLVFQENSTVFRCFPLVFVDPAISTYFRESIERGKLFK